MGNADRIAIAYFVYLAITAWLVPRVRAKRRVFVSASALAIASAIWTLANANAHAHANANATRVAWMVSACLPILWLLLGYWLPAGLWREPMPGAEAWLRASDRWLQREPFAHLHGAAAPRAWLRVLEAAYLLVHVMVPGGLIVMIAASSAIGPTLAADLFWTPILLAGYSCYGTLPWLQTRPPRALGTAPLTTHDATFSTFSTFSTFAAVDASNDGAALHRLNLQVLDRLSVHANTFPSGHSAVAIVIALFVLHVSPIASLSPALGPGFLILATLIALATVLCRYHYTADTLAGLALGLAAWLIARAVVA